MFEFDIKLVVSSVEKASFTWRSPSNIALVKYWGKSNPQIPKNASISFTLKNSYSETKVDFLKIADQNSVSFDFFFEGSKKDEFKPKIAKRSEEHTSELQSPVRIPYAVFCLKKSELGNALNHRLALPDRVKMVCDL